MIVKTPPITWSRSERLADTALLGLCVFSVVNPIVAQAVSFLFPHEIAGMNLMQWFQGLCFPLILIVLPALPRDRVGFAHSFSRLLWAYVIALVFLHLRLLAAGRVPTDMVNTERIVYFKVVFALLLWYCASRVVQSPEAARMLLLSILLGAVLSAAWLLICYFSGLGSAHYAEAGIRATAGSEGISGKGMVGFLLPAAAGAMFLSLREDSYRWAACAALLTAAVFVTFDRSAQVAFAVGLSWIVVWWLAFASPRPSARTILPFVCIILVLGTVYFAYHGTEELAARWTRDFDRGEIGSGRGAFYTTAWNWFWRDSSTLDFLFGMGYGNIYDLMHVGSGIFRHTHSDLFDMLLIGGVVGLVLYLLLFHTVASLARDVPMGSTEFATLGVVLLSFGVMSLLTGLTAFPHAMYAFGAQCICVRMLVMPGEFDPVLPYRSRCAWVSPSASISPAAYPRV